MMKGFKWLLVLLVVLLFCSIALTGCGGGGTQESQYVFRSGYMREIESLNPMVIWSVQAYEVM